MNPFLAALEPEVLALVQPMFNELLTAVINPEIQKLEGRIGNAQVQSLIQNLTAAVTAFLAAEIAKI